MSATAQQPIKIAVDGGSEQSSIVHRHDRELALEIGGFFSARNPRVHHATPGANRAAEALPALQGDSVTIL
jgi:hypothetical protein